MGRARLGPGKPSKAPGSPIQQTEQVYMDKVQVIADPVERVIERIVDRVVEVPVEVIRYVDREVIKEVIEEVPVIVTKEIEVIKEVPVEVIKEVQVQVEVIKEVEVRVPHIQHIVPRWCRWTILLAVVELIVIGILLEAHK